MENKPPKLKALLIGINQYGGEANLQGCENDVALMKQVLQEQCDSEVQLKIKTLLNGEANRQNTINTFQRFFSDLEDGDQALFYFSGHGSRMPAPKEFWYSDHEDDKYLETFVLSDSRHPGGCDLADKELSYLIWTITQVKKVFFTIIADSCYSGGISRGPEANVRHRPDFNQNRAWNEFLGWKNYKFENGKAFVPSGNRIVIAACKADEVSVEYMIERKINGVFTYSLAKVLKQSKGRLTYEELVSRVQSKVYGLTYNQHPQVDTSDSKQSHTIFLGNAMRQTPASYLLYYNYQAQAGLPIGWLINVGAIHGIEMEHDSAFIDLSISSQLVPENVSNKVKIVKVLTSHSIVAVPNNLSKDHQYRVVFTNFPSKALNVSFNPNNDPEGVEIINQVQAKQPSAFLNFRERWEDAEYLIHAENNQYWLRPLGELSNNVFQRLNGFSKVSATQLLYNLQTIARWHQIMQLSNPLSKIKKDQFDLSFHMGINKPSENESSKELVPVPDFLNEEIVLDFQRSPDPNDFSGDAVFKLQIKNNSDQTYWLSALFIGSDYSVSNDYLPIKKLAPGETTCLENLDPKGYPTPFINLLIEPIYLEKGILKITEFFKLLISTEPFSTMHLNQEGIPFNSQTVLKKSDSEKEESDLKAKSDWDSIDFAVHIKAVGSQEFAV